MLKDQIVVGRSYVNEDACIVREVVEELDDRRVKFNTFDLSTGKFVPTRHKVWDKAQLARWADRETSLSETALLHPYQSRAWLDTRIPPDSAGSPPEIARSAADEMPGPHTFPVGK